MGNGYLARILGIQNDILGVPTPKLLTQLKLFNIHCWVVRDTAYWPYFSDKKKTGPEREREMNVELEKLEH